MTTSNLGCGSRDCVLEIRPRQLEGPLDHFLVNWRNPEHLKDRRNGTTGLSGVLLSPDQVVDRRHGVGSQNSVGLSSLHRRPDRAARFNVGPAVEQHVQHDIDVEKEPSHRCFSMRCLR